MKPYLILISLFLFCTASAQKDNSNRKDSVRILNAKCFYFDLSVGKNRSDIPSLPVDSIRFVDVRFDTTFIALNWRPRITNGVYKSKYDLAGGLARSLTRYCNKYYAISPHKGAQFVCYIKEFSITWKQDLLDHFMQGIDFSQIQNNNVHAEIECYYQSGENMYPAARIDTTFKGDFLIHQTTFEDAVKAMLEPFQNKIEHLDIASVLQRKAYTPQQIEERYASRFQIPVLTTTEYKKGIYTSVADFRNNTPSVDSFLMSTDKMKYSTSFSDYFGTMRLLTKAVQKRNTAVFFYTADKELINPSSVFAYCDGTTFWIQHGAMYYPLVRVGNAFEFIYTYYYTDGNQLTQNMQFLMPLNMSVGRSN